MTKNSAIEDPSFANISPLTYGPNTFKNSIPGNSNAQNIGMGAVPGD